MNYPVKNISGQKFNRWTVLGRAPNNKDSDAMWFCNCDCGTSNRIVRGVVLRNGESKSCGCYQRECAQKLNQLPTGEGAFNQMMNGYKQMAKARGLPFEITKEEFKALTKRNCHYCGVAPSQVYRRKFGTTYTYNGVDRVDSSQGYKVSNCVPCCGVHNLMKLDMTVEQFIAACQSVVDYQEQLKMNLSEVAMTKTL